MYYVLHQIMLTEALTIYIVVVSLEHELSEPLGAETQDELPFPMTRAQNLDFWLGSIHARAPAACPAAGIPEGGRSTHYYFILVPEPPKK